MNNTILIYDIKSLPREDEVPFQVVLDTFRDDKIIFWSSERGGKKPEIIHNYDEFQLIDLANEIRQPTINGRVLP